jgi:hypothetical protein
MIIKKEKGNGKMKKQLLIVALALGFIATTECKKTKTYQLAAGSSINVISKKMPSLPAGVTAIKIGKKRYTVTNNSPTAVTVTVRRKK